MLHLVHLEVVVAARKVGRLVYLDGVRPGLAREVRLLGLGMLRLRHGLLGGVGQGDQSWEDLVQILYGGSLAGLLVDLLRDGQAVPYVRVHFADVGGDGPWAIPNKWVSPS